MAQQGSGPGPGRSSRQPDAEHRGHSDRSQRPDRGRRAGRPERPGWQQHDPFGPDPDGDLPSWAEPVYEARPAGTRVRRPTPGEPSGRGYRETQDTPGPDGYGDPHGDRGSYQDPYDYQDQDVHRDPHVARHDAGYREAADGYADGDIGMAEPGEAASGPPRPVGRRGRAAAARLRKSRRRVYRWCGTAIVLVVLAAGGWILFGQPTTKPTPYVTSLQAGEFKSVPDACTAVGTQVLGQYLPGPGRTSTQEQSSSTASQCSFTIDKKPLFLVLEVSAVAFEPFAAASGDGSATQNARDNFGLVRQNLAAPPKKSPLPPAVISAIPKLGQQAFTAFQPEHVAGIVTYVATVVVRERNVLITVSLSGQESGRGFGPVSQATLAAGARAAVAGVLAKVQTQPTA